MELKEKQKLYVLLGILGVAGLVFYYNLLLKPQFSRFIVNNREFYAVKKRVAKARGLIASKARIRAQYANLKKQSELLEKSFPNQDEVPTLLEDFSSIAESSGVRILKIKPLEVLGDTSSGGDRVGNKVYSEFPILIEASAGYHQCGKFVNKLEDMDRFIKIDDLDIRDNSSNLRRHNIRLRVTTYVMH